MEQSSASLQADLDKTFERLRKDFLDAAAAVDYEPPIELLNKLDILCKCTKIIKPMNDDEVFEPDQNVVYIDKAKFPEIARALGFDLGNKPSAAVEKLQSTVKDKGDAAEADKEADAEEENEIPVYDTYIGSEMKEDPFFYACSKATANLRTNYVAYGAMVNKVLSKQLVVHKGALIFNMEVRVPTDPDTTEKFGSYSDCTCENLHFRIFFNHINGICITHLDDNTGGLALSVSVIASTAEKSQTAFRTLGLPPAVYNDKRYHTFVFELPYNYFESYKQVNLFLLMCNYWAKEYNPDRISPIANFQRAYDFNRLLEPTSLRLAPIKNTQEYDCYQFASFTKNTDESKPISESGITIELPTHTVRVKNYDVDDLMITCDITADMVDFYVRYGACSLLRKNQKQVGILPANFYTLFTDNFDPSDTPVERSYQITRNWTNIKSRYQIEDDVFSKTYILMPVYVGDHWYLVVITYPFACLLPNGVTPKVMFIDGFSDGSTKDTEFQNIITFLEFHFNQVQQSGKYVGKEFNRERYVKVLHDVAISEITKPQSAILTTLYADEILRTFAPTPIDLSLVETFTLEDVTKFTHYVRDAIQDTTAVKAEFKDWRQYKPEEVV
uniref:ULP_PROTEASE domain-containing protein n=1 Tax=Panagrellus redivivus TaxID=6233 RepID=A0A7E4VA37_PANRE